MRSLATCFVNAPIVIVGRSRNQDAKDDTDSAKQRRDSIGVSTIDERDSIAIKRDAKNWSYEKKIE